MSKNTRKFLYIFLGCIIGAFLGQEVIQNNRIMILFAIGLMLFVIILMKIKKLK